MRKDVLLFLFLLFCVGGVAGEGFILFKIEK